MLSATVPLAFPFHYFTLINSSDLKPSERLVAYAFSCEYFFVGEMRNSDSFFYDLGKMVGLSEKTTERHFYSLLERGYIGFGTIANNQKDDFHPIINGNRHV